MINYPQSKKLKTLSLFSGAGGLDLGFHIAGFDIKYCIEIEKKFCETLSANKKYFKNSVIINSDISKVNPQNINSDIDFIIGGPPCQSFSASGFRKGLNDERGNLFLEFIRLLKYFKPKGFLFENVRGLTHSNEGNAIKTIVNEFEKCGYVLNIKLLNAADYGVPQLRERVFLLGSKDKMLSFPFPTHGPDSKNKKKYVSVMDAIKDIYNPKEKSKPFGGIHGHLLPLVPEGENYHYFTSDMGYKKPIFKWRTKFSNFLYKVSRNEPCRTIQARPGKYSGPFHWKNRKMNVEELKRLMTFPKDFIFNCGLTIAHHQLGNAVPPLLSYKIALGIRSQILNDVPKPDFIKEGFVLSFDNAKKLKRRKTMIKVKKNRNLDQLDLFQNVV
jgi:DNA (cytosine-5)-methyltransferase 1